MGQVPQVLVEEILERLDVKSLVRFTSVSKQWSSMIKSRSFALRHLIRAQSRDPHILVGGDQLRCESNPYPWLRTLELLDPFIMVNYIPKPNRTSPQFTQSCDGLVCIYDFEQVVYVFNPATRWCRFLPPAMIQQINNLSSKVSVLIIFFYVINIIALINPFCYIFWFCFVFSFSSRYFQTTFSRVW